MVNAITLDDMVEGATFKSAYNTMQLHFCDDCDKVFMSVIEGAPFPNYPDSPVGTKKEYVVALNKWGYEKCMD